MRQLHEKYTLYSIWQYILICLIASVDKDAVSGAEDINLDKHADKTTRILRYDFSFLSRMVERSSRNVILLLDEERKEFDSLLPQ